MSKTRARASSRVELIRTYGVRDELEIPAFACSLHPQHACWAWSGRSSKVVIRTMGSADADADPSNAQGPLGGESSVMHGGKGKFGLDLQFVSVLRDLSSLIPPGIGILNGNHTIL